MLKPWHSFVLCVASHSFVRPRSSVCDCDNRLRRSGTVGPWSCIQEHGVAGPTPPPHLNVTVSGDTVRSNDYVDVLRAGAEAEAAERY